MRLAADQLLEAETVGAGVRVGAGGVAVVALVLVGNAARGVGGSAVGAKVLHAKPKSKSRGNQRRIEAEIISHLPKSLNEFVLSAEQEK